MHGSGWYSLCTGEGGSLCTGGGVSLSMGGGGSLCTGEGISLCTGGGVSLCTGLGVNRLVLGPHLSHSEPLPPDLASEGTKVPPTSDVTGPRDPEPRRSWQWPLKPFLANS